MTDLVRVRIGDQENTVTRNAAIAADWEILPDESSYDAAGRVRGATRKGGRPMKPRTTVAKEAAAKEAVTEPAANKGEAK